MTTDRARMARSIGCGILVAALVVSACAGTSSVRFGDSVDVSGYPQDIQAAYRVFEVRCSRCHTLARPLNARIKDPEHWVRYVTRMRRNPSSGINPKDADIILSFLLYYTKQVAAEDGEEPAADAIPSASPTRDPEPASPTPPDPNMPEAETNREPDPNSTDGRPQ